MTACTPPPGDDHEVETSASPKRNDHFAPLLPFLVNRTLSEGAAVHSTTGGEAWARVRSGSSFWNNAAMRARVVIAAQAKNIVA